MRWDQANPKIEERKRTEKKKKADEKWMRAEGPHGKAEDEDEENKLKKTIFEETAESRGERGDCGG